MTIATLTSKGQVTLPKAVRDRLGLHPGSRLAFQVDAQGRLVGEVQGPSGIAALAGSLAHRAPNRPVSVAAMQRAIRQRAAQDDRRIRDRR